MEYRKFGNYIVIRADADDEVAAVIRQVAEQEKVTFAKVSGIGAVRRVTLAFYHTESNEYRTNYFPGMYEITSMMGNVMTDESGNAHVHAHVTIADRGHRIYGGHLRSAIVTANSEIILEVIPVENLSRICSEEYHRCSLKFD